VEFDLLLLCWVAEELVLEGSIVLSKLGEEVLHEVHYADGSDLVGGHLDEVEAELALVWVNVASLDEDFLLLSDGGFEAFHPAEDVAVRGGELVSAADFDQVVEGFLVLLVSELERKFFDFKLAFE